MSQGNRRTTRKSRAMRRWDGRARITTDWFTYHGDPELNFIDGDLLVFLHQPESLEEAPSFRLHTEYLSSIGLQSLVDQSVVASLPARWAKSARPYGQPSTTVRKLYLPAPTDADKEAVEQYRLATRNFFACLYDRPMAGNTLGTCLEDVMNRAQHHRPNDAQKDILAYMNRRGYLDFRECVDHALAALHLAERFHLESLWVNAFAHCVGMNHSLHTSIEFDAISRVTKATITRARLEMDIRLDRVAKSLTTFFDSEISGSCIGLTQSAKDHMDRFRSFLHAYYIEKHGFWPPAGFTSSFILRRSLYRTMYVDFRALYHSLVNSQATPSLQSSNPVEGGICTLQNVRAFDTRHGLETLPHPLPLLPRSSGTGAGLGFTITNRRKERGARHAALIMALTDASNQDADLMKCRLVRSYVHYEKQTVVDDFNSFNLTEGRKVRWIVIYAIFQILASVISAPKEVTDTERVSYPLCCQRPKAMPWAVDAKDLAGIASSGGRSMPPEDNDGDGPKQDPRPDVDHISSDKGRSLTTLADASSVTDIRGASAPKSLSSTAIILKSAQSSPPLPFLRKQRAFPTEIATTSSSAFPARRKHASFHEIIVYRYGNGLNNGDDDPPRATGTVHSLEDSQSDHQSPSRITITGGISSRRPTSPRSRNHPPYRLRLPALLLGPPEPTTPSTQSGSFPSPTLPDSPTVPSLAITPPTSPESSISSSISRLTSHSSTSPQRAVVEIDQDSNKSTDTVINTVVTASASVPLPTPVPPKPLNIPTKRFSPGRGPSSQAARVSLKTLTSVPVFGPAPVTAGLKRYLSLPADTGSGRVELPTAFLRAYSSSKQQAANKRLVGALTG